MDRRNFFRKAFRDSSKAVVKHVAKKVEQQASRWIRPPFAVEELNFLLTCTRCDACIEACPHQVIFRLSPRLGAKVAATPALDLLNHACHLCADWPCVAACETGALRLPETEADDNAGNTVAPPVLARASINTQSCLPYHGPECGACAGSCPVEGALEWQLTRPVINPLQCTGCALCRQACITDPPAIDIQSVARAVTASPTTAQQAAS